MVPDSITIVRKLGKGKSGVSYLARYKGRTVVFKEMHDETVPYYSFTKPKIELELDAYEILRVRDIRIPELIHADKNENYLIKEFVDGKTITEMITVGKLDDAVFMEALRWERTLKEFLINIDYYPDNFIYDGRHLNYIDYELNPYTEEWNFRNWGIFYWLNGPGFKKFIETRDPRHINVEGTGIPVRSEETEKERERILALVPKDIPLPPPEGD